MYKSKYKNKIIKKRFTNQTIVSSISVNILIFADSTNFLILIFLASVNFTNWLIPNVRVLKHTTMAKICITQNINTFTVALNIIVKVV